MLELLSDEIDCYCMRMNVSVLVDNLIFGAKSNYFQFYGDTSNKEENMVEI